MDWNVIKAAGKAYPESRISIVEQEYATGMRSAWVNTGYKDYVYKALCPTLGILGVEFADMNGISEQEIQDYFTDELTKVCVSHLISRIPTDNGIEMLFYFDDKDLVVEKLGEIYEDENKLVDFSCRIQDDPTWSAVQAMLDGLSE